MLWLRTKTNWLTIALQPFLEITHLGICLYIVVNPRKIPTEMIMKQACNELLPVAERSYYDDASAEVASHRMVDEDFPCLRERTS